MADKPRVEYLSHTDGRWIEYTLESFQQRALGQHDEGGLFIGRDPQCDIVLDDDGIEDFHVRLFGRGHHPEYIEVIAGSAERGEMKLYPGDEQRGSASFAGWRESTFDLERATPTLRAAWAVAEDARLEGRHVEATKILADAGYRRIRVPWRKKLPDRLAHSQQLARIRVEEVAGTVVHALGSLDRFKNGITIGRDANNDVVVPSAKSHRIAMRGENRLVIQVLAGETQEIGPYAPSVIRDSHEPDRRWQRFRLGEAIVQVCRYPRRGEALQ